MKTRIAFLGLLLSSLFVAGCGSVAAKLNDIHIGMTKAEVIGILGKPDTTSAQANIEYLTYYLETESSSRFGYTGTDRPYMVRLVEGKVESFGRFMQLLDIYNRPVGFNPQNPASPLAPGMTVPVRAMDLPTALQRLDALRKQGVLTEEEFQQAKRKLLSP